MEIREVAVIGLGTMGAGIAEVFARAGLGVTAIEADPAALRHGMNIVEGSLERAVRRGRLDSAERDAIARRVRPAGGYAEAASADLAIEAVPERPEIKRLVFAELDAVCRPDAILATNTSSLSVTAIAAATSRPGRVIGMHFFNPAPVMRLVEVVTTVLASDGVQAATAGLARRLGKTPVQVTDRAGFVANALLLPYLNHAAALLGAGAASREDIDAAITGGAGLPMGPLALLDLIGLDTSLSIMEVLSAEFGGTRYTPAPLLRRLADAGQAGRKSGRGFYDYPGQGDGTGAGGEKQASGSNGQLAGQSRNFIPRGDEIAGLFPAVTLVPSGDGASPVDLAALAAAAGLPVAAAPGPGGGVVILENPDAAPVLPSALAASHPEAVVGLRVHAAPPAGEPLAELVTTRVTSPAAAAAAEAAAGRLGLRVVRAPDRPGYLTGTLLYPHLADAVRMVQDGYASAADVDTAMTLGCGYPRGPLQILDEAGPARVLAALRAMHEAYGDPAFAPPPLLAEHVAAGLPFRG